MTQDERGGLVWRLFSAFCQFARGARSDNARRVGKALIAGTLRKKAHRTPRAWRDQMSDEPARQVQKLDPNVNTKYSGGMVLIYWWVNYEMS